MASILIALSVWRTVPRRNRGSFAVTEFEMKEWNQRYVYYSRAHGKTPGEMLEADVSGWPGGKMCGFIIWSMKMVSAFYDLHDLKGSERDLRRVPGGQDAYDEFLEEACVGGPLPDFTHDSGTL